MGSSPEPFRRSRKIQPGRTRRYARHSNHIWDLRLNREERRGFWKIVLLTPPYWAMLSVAGWRAVWQLWRRPHFWEKTPHEAPRPGSTTAR